MATSNNVRGATSSTAEQLDRGTKGVQRENERPPDTIQRATSRGAEW
jgi:hypothetical protein